MAFVYQHISTVTNKVFYVGIGSKENLGRAYQKGKRNHYWQEIAKDGYDVEIVTQNITWREACSFEKLLIKKHGRIDIGTGTLCNRTGGGQGAYGAIITAETRRKISAKKLGVKRGSPSAEVRLKQSLALKGKMPKNFEYLKSGQFEEKRIARLKGCQSQETINARSERWKGPGNPRTKRVIHTTYGIFYENLNDAWISSGLKTSRSFFSMMLLGIRKNKTPYRFA